jgi:hypothetical protein
MKANLSDDERGALSAMYAAAGTPDLPHGGMQAAHKLMNAGHSPIVAVRVAFTGRLDRARPAVSANRRPGREIAEAIDASLGTVVLKLAPTFATASGETL